MKTAARSRCSSFPHPAQETRQLGYGHGLDCGNCLDYSLARRRFGEGSREVLELGHHPVPGHRPGEEALIVPLRDGDILAIPGDDAKSRWHLLREAAAQ